MFISIVKSYIWGLRADVDIDRECFVTSRGLRFVSNIQGFLIVPLKSSYITMTSYMRGYFVKIVR